MATTVKDFIQTDEVFVGAENAPITLVCFIDYESPACAQLNDILNKLLVTYPEKIRINIRHFPLANKHQKSMKAAEAIVAAMQEDMIWPMNNILFQNQKKLGIISLKQHAKEIGCINKRFLEQVINGTYAWQVREDLMEGLSRGIKDVPAIYFNEILFNKPLTIETLSQKIEALS